MTLRSKSDIATEVEQNSRLSRAPRLPLAMADFGRRGFRDDRPAARAVLEEHARNFLRGFNLAAARWTAPPHEELHDRIPDDERGFAYEGAGMFAGLADLVTAGRAHAVRRLSAGPGDGYVHLVNVGAGWMFTPVRVHAVPRLPARPLLRWLALDGAGFGSVYFGGLPALYRRAAGRGARWEARLAGCGRALWFVESGDPAGVAAVVDRLAPAARPHVWAGVGLAVTYAGAADDDALDRLCALAAPHRDHFGQGVVFGAAARHRAGIVPAHTRNAAARFLGASVADAARWCDEAAAGLAGLTDVHAYLRWKQRLRRQLADRDGHGEKG